MEFEVLENAVCPGAVATETLPSQIVRSEVLGRQVELPEGFEIRVRLGTQLTTGDAMPEQTFPASLARKIEKNGVRLAPSDVDFVGVVRQVQSRAGGGEPTLGLLLKIARVGGVQVPIQTEELRLKNSSVKGALGRILGVGLIGALAGASTAGRDGAAKGAGAGIVVGGAVGMGDRRGELTLAHGKELSFKLKQPLVLPVP